ncbi:MAG: hypothetical protein BGO39_19755 [Chloroflexi bacterium 54-19]|nr:MAG: hypothetical protein BGO39_19755 [Chloroflexi bacterium 54-19]
MRVLHPGLPEFEGYELARTQLSGYTGLFSFSMKDPTPVEAQYAFVDALKLYGKGVSWGGYESLLLPTGDNHRSNPEVRESMGYDEEMYRLSIGLESYEDLIADLENGFAARAVAIKNLSVTADI